MAPDAALRNASQERRSQQRIAAEVQALEARIAQLSEGSSGSAPAQSVSALTEIERAVEQLR